VPSMLQDLRNGKPCEVEAINGIVCRQGRKAGVKTPVNDWIVQMIHEMEAGKRKPGEDNIITGGPEC